jgi:GTP cyclohydrolase I
MSNPTQIPNLAHLESSTGSWERGRSNLNARSPTSTSVLESMRVDTTGAGPSKVIFPRTPREGYGFRPASGASTPALLESEETQETQEEEAEVELVEKVKPVQDAAADKKFNDEVRAALTQPATIGVGRNEVVPAGGIADAEGLGWPGKLC